MKNEDDINKKTLSDTLKNEDDWRELLEFANQSILGISGLIDPETFIEQGKKRFNLLSKNYFLEDK